MANESEVKRALRVQFSATGQARLKQDVAAVDKSLSSAGKSGTAALGKLDAGIGKLGEGMAKALDPIDKAFAGTDTLFSLLGKAGAVGAVAGAAFELVKVGLEALTSESRRAAAAQEELAAAAKRTAATLADALGSGISDEALGQLSPEAVLEYRRSLFELDEARKAYLDELAKDTIRAEQIRVNGTEDQKRDLAQGRWYANAQLEILRDQMAEKREMVLLGEAEIREAERRARGEDGTGESKPEKAAKAIVSTAREAGKAWSSLRAEADSYLLSMEMAIEAEQRAHQWRVQAVEEAQAAYAKLSDRVSEYARRQREAYDASVQAQVDAVTGALGGAAEAFGQAAAAALLAGESIMGILNQQLQALAAQAVWEALKSTATGLYYLAVPGMQAAAGLAFDSAAVWSAIAAGAGIGVAATGGMGGSGGGGGGAPSSPSQASSSGLAGEPGGSAGPVVVNVNFSGPASGLGRFLADELNAEARRAGGARIDPRAVR
jgi:hypothetical protein